MTEESSWLRAYVETGDESAFTQLTERYIGLVYHAALRQLGNASLAEEVMQTVFSRLARKAPALLGHANLVGWLHTTTRYAAKEMLRSESRRRQRDHEGYLMEQLLDQPLNSPSWEQLRPVVDEALSELNDADRTAILLRYFADLPLTAVGIRLNSSENTARMRVGRALEKLRLKLAKRGITSSASAIAIGLAQHTSFAAPPALGAMIAKMAVAQAGASAAGVTAFGIIQIMTTSKITIAAATITALALGTAYHQGTRASAAEHARATEAKEKAILLSRLKDAEENRSRLAQADEASAPAAPAVAKILDASKSPALPPPQTLEDAIERLLVSNPDLPPLFMRQETIRFRSKYGPLYEALAFSPTQIARFEDALSDHAQANSDIRVAGFAEGVKRDDPAVRKLLDQALEQRNSQLRVLLGDQAYGQFQEYERTSRGRILSDRLASELYYTAHPISAEQAKLIARIAVDHSAQTTGTGMAAWDKMIGEAQAVLSPEQLKVLQTMKEQAELGMKIHEITGPVSRQFSESAGGSQVTPTSVSVR